MRRDDDRRGVIDFRGKLAGWFLDAVSVIVPRYRRAEWRAEWRGEIAHSPHREYARVLGAWRHAFRLRLYDMDALRQDVHYAIRGLRKRPGFSVAVGLTLALGIGANTAVFSLVNGVMLRPLPYADPDRLYTLFEQDSLGRRQLASYPTFLDWREQSDAFNGLVYVRGTTVTVLAGDVPSLYVGAFVSEDFFTTMGAVPAIGRPFHPQDFQTTANPVALLSHAVWQRDFGGDSTVIGRTIALSEITTTVVGVMPPAFAYPDWGAVGTVMWMPTTALPPRDQSALMQRDFHADSRVIARLGAGVTLAAAQAQMNGIASRLAATYPRASASWTRVNMTALGTWVLGNVRPRLLMLSGAVALVLLICCANVTNLFLAQGTARTGEFAIRAALGAGRGRVLRQLLTESLLLALAGGILGTILAVAAVNLLQAGAPRSLPRLYEVGLDLRVLGVAGGLSALTALVPALVPARRAASPNLVTSLKGAGGAASGGRARLPGWLVASQVALAVVLFIGAGLLINSLWRLSRVDPGYDPEHRVGAWIQPPSPKYDEADAVVQLYSRLAQAVQSLPRVSHVALVNHGPGGGLPSRAVVGGGPAGTDEDRSVLFRTISAGYFATMGIPVRAGREFDDRDMTGPPGALIVNETFARVWGDRSPVGERLTVLKAAKERPDFGEPIYGTVVGVVGDVKSNVLRQPVPAVYVPFTHNPWSAIVVIARTVPHAGQMIPAIERALLSVEPEIPLAGVGPGIRTMEQTLSQRFAVRRFNAVLVGAFALAALLLALIGIYGVMSYVVASESREIGIRMALGARYADVRRSVMGRAARLTATGMALGVLGALGLTRFLTSLLYQVTPNDPLTFGAVILLFILVALFASYLPARRAAAVDPVIVLKA